MRHERLRVLAVEDEGLIAMELADILERLGYSVIGPASSVDSALTYIARGTADAAVVDANLGGFSAKPVVDALHARGIPLIIASGYEPQELARFGLEGRLVRKPYGAGDLAAALDEVLAQPTHSEA